MEDRIKKYIYIRRLNKQSNRAHKSYSLKKKIQMPMTGAVSALQNNSCIVVVASNVELSYWNKSGH